MDNVTYVMPPNSPYVDPLPNATARYEQQVEVPSKDLLIVEDELVLCDLLADVLEGEGYIVRKAGNGLDALQLIGERRPHLIFLDMMMPVMDGWQFLVELRANPAWANIPVVLMTAVYDLSSLEHKTGARAILSKPFDIELIIEAVKLFAD